MSTEIDRKIAAILVADGVGYSKHMKRDENVTFKATWKIYSLKRPFYHDVERF